MKQKYLQLIAAFIINLVIAFPIYTVEALTINHNPVTDAAVGINNATINWTTDENSTSKVNYGQESLTNSAANESNATQHSIILTGLSENTTYKYELVSVNGTGYEARANNSGNYYNFTTNFTAPDTTPPNITAEIPEIYNQNTITIKGQTEPNSLVHGYVNPAPARIGIFNFDRQTFADSNGEFTITLNLDSSKENNTIVLWAKDKAGNTAVFNRTLKLDVTPPVITINEIPESAIETDVNVNGTVSEPVKISVYRISSTTEDEGLVDEIDADDTFETTIRLDEGSNTIKIEAVDAAGSKWTYEKTVSYDSKPPEIMSPKNINVYSPSYIPELPIEGQISENATVVIYVNGKVDANITTDTDGTFSAQINLKREVLYLCNTSTDSYGERGECGLATGNAWKNNVTIIAIDRAGRNSSVSGQVLYAACGYGAWWDINITEPYPDTLTPALIIKGQAMIGFNFDLGWQGGSSGQQILATPGMQQQPPNAGNAYIRFVRVTHADISDMQGEWYDLDWINGNIDYQSSADYMRTYARINIRPIDPNPEEGNWTFYAKEENISKHRLNNSLPGATEIIRNRYGCKVPGFGCVKIPVQVEIQFSSDVFNGTQRNCWDIEIPIDRRAFNASNIPVEFLNASINILNQTITLIDMVLKPLNTVKVYTFYACLGMWGVWFLLFAKKFFSCEAAAAASKTSSQKDWSVEDAKQGQCEAKHKNDQQTLSDCQQCENELRQIEDFATYQQYVCDRIFCPSPLTLQEYIRKNKGNPDSYCSGQSAGYDNIKEIYGYEGGARWEQYTKPGPNTKCDYLHLPEDKDTPQCCAVEYDRQWGTACLLMDEVKDSYCLAGQSANQPADSMTKEGVQCNRLWNAVAGFCEPGGGVKPELVNSQYDYAYENIEAGAGRRLTSEKIKVGESNYDTNIGTESKDSKIWYSIIPVEPTNLEGEVTYTSAVVERGYVGETDDILAPGKLEPGATFTIQEKKKFFPVRKIVSGKLPTNSETGLPDMPADFLTDLKGAAYNGNQITETSAKELWNTIASKIGISDQVYIADPTSSLLRSIQCGCLTAITTYLGLYRQMMEAVMRCFQTILLTGDGKSGVCQAVLTVYICDLIYDVISCFVKKYSYSVGDRAGGGFGQLLSALTNAGTSVHSRVVGRYGESSVFNAIFNEKKLAHAICLFAFTGDWIFDAETILGDTFSVPINSTALIYPATRRFISASTVSNPPGLATFNYHLGIGLFAGARLYNVRMWLVCSSDYSCTDADFKNSECDCSKKGGEQRRQIQIDGFDGTLEQGEVIGEIGQGVDQYSQFEGVVRYDKACLEWTYKDKDQNEKTSQKCVHIDTTGGNPPAYCQFDIGSVNYRCDLKLGTESATAFDGLPKPTKTTAFTVGDNVGFDVRITNNLPDNAPVETENEYTKYLDIIITNSQGVIVYQQSDTRFNPAGYEVINSEGLISQKMPKNFILKKEDITSTSSVTTLNCQVTDLAQIIQTQTTTTPCDSTMIINHEGNRQFNYQFARKDQTGKIVPIDPASNNKCEPYDYVNKRLKCGRTIFTLKDISQDLAPRANVITLDGSGATTSARDDSICAQPQKFNARFVIYASRYDGARYVPSSQIALDRNRQPLDVTVPFEVSCLTAGVGAGAGTGQLSIENIYFGVTSVKDKKLLVNKNDLYTINVVVKDDADALEIPPKFKIGNEDYKDMSCIDDTGTLCTSRKRGQFKFDFAVDKNTVIKINAHSTASSPGPTMEQEIQIYVDSCPAGEQKDIPGISQVWECVAGPTISNLDILDENKNTVTEKVTYANTQYLKVTKGKKNYFSAIINNFDANKHYVDMTILGVTYSSKSGATNKITINNNKFMVELTPSADADPSKFTLELKKTTDNSQIEKKESAEFIVRQ